MLFTDVCVCLRKRSTRGRPFHCQITFQRQRGQERQAQRFDIRTVTRVSGEKRIIYRYIIGP